MHGVGDVAFYKVYAILRIEYTIIKYTTSILLIYTFFLFNTLILSIQHSSQIVQLFLKSKYISIQFRNLQQLPIKNLPKIKLPYDHQRI